MTQDGRDGVWVPTLAAHAHSVEEANAGLWRDGERCAECPNAVLGERMVITSIDETNRVITIGLPEAAD